MEVLKLEGLISGLFCSLQTGDAIRNSTDSMVIVSGDSDLEPAVEWVRRNHPRIKITVYIPVLADELRQRRNDNYYRMGVTCKPLPLADISRHLLPATIPLNEKENVTRPAEWVLIRLANDQSPMAKHVSRSLVWIKLRALVPPLLIP